MGARMEPEERARALMSDLSGLWAAAARGEDVGSIERAEVVFAAKHFQEAEAEVEQRGYKRGVLDERETCLHITRRFSSTVGPTERDQGVLDAALAIEDAISGRPLP